MIQLYEIVEENNYYYVRPSYQIAQPEEPILQRIFNSLSTFWNSLWRN